MLGGEHGKMKYGPPDGHSPVCESLLPKEKLKIEPCFNLGNIPKGLICGLPEELDHGAFVPRPVDTSHVSDCSNYSFWPFCLLTFNLLLFVLTWFEIRCINILSKCKSDSD